MNLVAVYVIYSKLSFDDHPGYIAEYLRSLNDVFLPLHFRRLRIFTTTQRKGTYLQWNDDNLRVVEELMRAKLLDELYAEDVARRKEGTDPRLCFESQLNAVARLGDTEALAPTVNLISSWVNLGVSTDRHIESSLQRWMDKNTKLWSISNPSYGCVIVAPFTWQRAWRVVTGVHSPVHLTKEWNRDVAIWRENYRHMDSYIRGVYWGNFFNDEHLERLGGRGRVRNQPFWKVWVDLPRGSFGALSRSPRDFATHAVQERLRAARKFLDPILMPSEGSLGEVSWQYLRDMSRGRAVYAK